jgi:hypothetical protein
MTDRAKRYYAEARERFDDMAMPKRFHPNTGRLGGPSVRRHKPGRVWNWHHQYRYFQRSGTFEQIGCIPYWAWERAGWDITR